MKPKRELPAIAEPPYRTKLGRGEVSRAVQAVYRDRLIVEHLPLVREIALRIQDNLPVKVDLDDLVHAGILGLLDAVDKYKNDKVVLFAGYAKHRIKNAILDSLRQLDWPERRRRRQEQQVEVVKGDVQREIADKMGVDVERWQQMMTDLHHAGLTPTSTGLLEGEEDRPVSDYPAKAETQPDSMYQLKELRGALRRAIGSLPDRYQKVLLLYYQHDLTMREIAQSLGINESRASQIHKTALERMAAVLNEAGVQSADDLQGIRQQ